MEIAVVVAGITDDQVATQPWIHGQAQLRDAGIHLHVMRDRAAREAFTRPYDAMLLHVWQDWMNRGRFDPFLIMPLVERQAAYRLRFPDTIQIVLNHTDESQRANCLPYWRPGDPLLWRTPPYDRAKLEPLPGENIWAYEKVWQVTPFNVVKPKYAAGFIGTPTGPDGYRAAVARETAKIGIGICRDGRLLRWRRPVPYRLHNYLMARCRIIVAPRGWGQQSMRHWSAWLSGKPVLTDRACASCELIPGMRLEEGVHYLVFDDPTEIPDIVSDWTRPSRVDELAQVAENGRRAALSYGPADRMVQFFRSIARAADTQPLWPPPTSGTT